MEKRSRKLTSKSANDELDELNAQLREEPGALRRTMEAHMDSKSKRKRNFEREASQQRLKQ
jgi:hypothetical protein